MKGEKFRLSVLTELQNRGVKYIFIACVDDLKGFPNAINAVYPKTKIQLCIVHMVRNSVRYVPWKDYKAVTADFISMYQALLKKVRWHRWKSLVKNGMINTRKLGHNGDCTGKTKYVIQVPCGHS